MSNVQKREQLHFEESRKQEQLEKFWQHKQHEMVEEEHKLTVENEVRHNLCTGLLKIFKATDAVFEF